ncbi:Down syndrome cell adhesion molecule-like protein Dscam2 [Polyplax serrata]|uniref:Down syndrome cell adhesion molecule-like protein Dscam2 n=1 Tax=Polyplax serrata TaxID=468196 RepID=A0ABR1AT41_POLSC
MASEDEDVRPRASTHETRQPNRPQLNVWTDLGRGEQPSSTSAILTRNPPSYRFVIGQYMTVHGDVISHVNISQVAVEDGGEYTCTAENRAGKVSHSARLNVYGLPYIRLIPKVTAIAGETLRLKCPVAGYPIEEIQWEQGGKILPTEIRQNVERDGTLVIRSVQKDMDFGVYSCSAKNKQGKSARRSAEIEVIGD